MIAAIIQARMSSTRLPEKIMLKACDKTMLEHMVYRISHSKKIDKILIATTTNPKDDVIQNFCIEKKIDYFRGSENDVLSRYKHACDYVNADIVVRICSDEPLIDPKVIDDVISVYQKNDYDYVNNLVPFPRTYPDGMSVEVFSSAILNESFLEAKKPSEREHVTFFMWKQPERYKIYKLDYKKDLSKFRLNLDYQEDYQLIKSVFERLYKKNPLFSMEDITNWLKKHPDVFELNSKIKSQQGWLKSYENDYKAGFR